MWVKTRRRTWPTGWTESCGNEESAGSLLLKLASYLPGLGGWGLGIEFDAVSSNTNPNPWRVQDILKRGLKKLAVDTASY